MRCCPHWSRTDILANAITWNSGGWQLAAVLGPALGGAMIAALGGTVVVYLCAAAGSVVFLVLAARIRHRPVDSSGSELTVAALVAGIRFVAHTPLILATITLDLFAVLLGGATTLLPIYAKDILGVGPSGLGWLNAADSLGAVIMAATLAVLPPMRHAGRTVLLAVAGFGVATLVFGISRSFPLVAVHADRTRRLRHGQCRGPGNARPAPHARSHARPCRRDREPVRRNIEPARRLRVGRGRRRVRACLLGRVRSDRHARSSSRRSRGTGRRSAIWARWTVARSPKPSRTIPKSREGRDSGLGNRASGWIRESATTSLTLV